MTFQDKLAVKPYRAKVNNWSHTFACHPQLIFEPVSVEEVQEIVRQAREQKRRVRPVGEHTAPGEAFCTDGWMVRSNRLNGYTKHEGNTATLGAGLRLREANKLLYQDGLCFPVVGSIDEISVGAGFANSTHGSGYRQTSITEAVVACTLVTADGQVRKLRRDADSQEDRELFAATGCGCGVTGFLVDITVKLVPAYGLKPTYETMCIREVLRKGSGSGGLVDVAKRNEFVKIWYFPNTTSPDSKKHDAILYRADPCESPPPPPAPTTLAQVQKQFIHFLHGLGVFICTFILPSLMPYFNMLLYYLQSRGTPMQAESSPGFLAQQMDCLYWQLVNEYAIPFTQESDYGALRALQDIIDFLDNDKVVGSGLTAPFEIRFSATAREHALSPLNHADADMVMYLEPIVYRPLNLQVPDRYHRLFDVFETIARRNGGKPHLAKPRRPPSNKAELHAMYPEIETWRNVVRKADPEGMFWSDFMEDQFGFHKREESKGKLSRTVMGKQSVLSSQQE